MLCGIPAFAQDDNTPRSAVVPSPMGIHTWFIIAAFGAFLAWCISYSLQLQKEALKRRTSREGLILRKNRYLEELAELESQKEAGNITEQRFRRLYINTRLRMAKVIEQIERIEQERDTSQDG
jgi:cytochrome c-type biogenesis protein CcmH/NrfG